MYNRVREFLGGQFRQRNDFSELVAGITSIDVSTRGARALVRYVTSLLSVLTPVSVVTKAIISFWIVVTVGFLLFPFFWMWFPFYYLLAGTSWLWLKAWCLRPILLLPGVVIAFVANLYVMLVPDFQRGAKVTKLALCQEWPLSWYITHPPKQTVI